VAPDRDHHAMDGHAGLGYPFHAGDALSPRPA
jgi:hypothetical protein